MTQPPFAPVYVPVPGPPSGAAIQALLDSLHSERRLIDELAAVMRRQRAAVAADDLQAVDDSVFATHRILLTLGEARRRRHALNRMFGDGTDAGMQRLEKIPGGHLTDSLRQARENLQIAALALSREVEINRKVLRDALASGDTYVGALLGASEPRACYTPDASRLEADRPGGVLFNRMA